MNRFDDQLDLVTHLEVERINRLGGNHRRHLGWRRHIELDKGHDVQLVAKQSDLDKNKTKIVIDIKYWVGDNFPR